MSINLKKDYNTKRQCFKNGDILEITTIEEHPKSKLQGKDCSGAYCENCQISHECCDPIKHTSLID